MLLLLKKKESVAKGRKAPTENPELPGWGLGVGPITLFRKSCRTPDDPFASWVGEAMTTTGERQKETCRLTASLADPKTK